MSIEDIVAAIPPTKIKLQEEGAYNPVWVDCSVEPHPFTPIPNKDPKTGTSTFRYLWVVTDDGTAHPVQGKYRLIVGIEFDGVPTVKTVLTRYGFGEWVDKQSQSDLEKLLTLGHPTVSAHFSEHRISADSSPTFTNDGKAFFGGELNSAGVGWAINNHSGRHSNSQVNKQTQKPLSGAEWNTLMQAAQALFKSQMGLVVSIDDPKIKT